MLGAGGGTVLDACVSEQYAAKMGTASAVPLKLLGHPGPQRTILSEHKHVVRHKDAVGVPGQWYV